MVFLCESVQIKMKAFILGPYAHLRLYLNSVASDNMVHARGGTRGQTVKLFKLLYLKSFRIDNYKCSNICNCNTISICN